MASLDQIAEALKRADAAGNVEDARALAKAYADMKAQQAAPPPAAEPVAPSPGPMDFASQAMSGVNEGIANTLGFPVEAATAVMNLGSAGINKLTGAQLPMIEKPFGGADTFR